MAKKKKKRAPKASESKAKLDGDLKVKRADEPEPEEKKESRGFADNFVSESAGNQSREVPEVEVEVKSQEVGTGKPRPFTPVKKAPTGKVACVAIGTRVSLKNKRGYSVEADVVNVDEGFVTFRVCGSDAKLQKLEAEVLADLQRGGNTVRMEF